MEKLLALANLERLLARFAREGTVWAPARDPKGDVALVLWRPEKPVTLDYRNFLQSPKSFLLPQNQTLLRFTQGKSEEPSLPEGATILFGVRPCDSRALLVLDRVFLNGDSPSAVSGSDHRDPYYARLRERTTVVALACTRTMPSCFCSSVGGGPGQAMGADVLAVDLDTDILLRPQTDRGQRLLESVAEILSEASNEAIKESQERITNAEGQLVRVKTDDSARRLRNSFDSPLWEAGGMKCLGCGTCSFLCPTCHCFDIADEVREGVGSRIRTWDCCAYPLFTLQGSGHNPRPTARERWRQRIMHKFRYAVESCGTSFCVGCGRCIRSCPVSLDLRTTLREVGE